MSSEGPRPSRQQEAAAWFAAERAGMMLIEQRAAFDQWRADPRNQAALDAMHELWDDLAVLKGATSAPSTRPMRSHAIAAAALMLVAIGGAGLGWLALQGDRTIQTVAGQQQTRSLPDGSLIAVNVASDVAYAIKEDRRYVKISDGEAAFTVKPDAKRPFVVHAGDFEMRAVGTAFNVRRRDGVIEVAVSEGKVEICRIGEQGIEAVLATLGAGQLLQFPASYAQGAFNPAPSPIPTAQVSEWRMRVVTYEDAPVRAVVADLNRYFEQKLQVEQGALLDRRVTVRLRVDDRERAIETLASLLDVDVRKTQKGETLTEREP